MWFMGLPWVISGAIFVAIFILAMLLALWIARQSVSSKTLKACHDVAGFTFGIIGVIYAVLLGFTVVEVNDRFHQAEENILQETAILVDLFRDAAVFPDAERDKIQQLIRNYTYEVYSDEWHLMAEERESEKARLLFHEIWNTYKELTPANDKEKTWYSLSLDKLNDMSQHRVLRLFHMHQSLGSMMWTMLTMGAIVTVLFMGFFAAESALVQTLMTTLLAGTIGFMLFLIMSLEGIYCGDVCLMPNELKDAVERFDQMLAEPKP